MVIRQGRNAAADVVTAENRHGDEDRNTMRDYRDKTRRQGGKAKGSAARASGFTLAELLISIGILGVGLTMSAALFPAGLGANKDSANDLLGTMICQNGLAVAKSRLKAFHVTGTAYTLLNDSPQVFTAAEMQYPYGSNKGTGFYVFGRQIQAEKNEYELMVIAFQKHPSGGDVVLKPATGTAYTRSGTGQFDFKNGGEKYAQVGATMILTGGSSSGSARIVSLGGKTAVLDNPISSRTTRNAEVKILYQEGVPISPILGVMSARTSLPER